MSDIPLFRFKPSMAPYLISNDYQVHPVPITSPVPFITFQFTFPLIFPENIRLAPTLGPQPLHFPLWTAFPHIPSILFLTSLQFCSKSLHPSGRHDHLKKKNVCTHIHTHIAFTLLDFYLYISVPDILFVFCSLSKSTHPPTLNISHESRYFAFIYCYIPSKEFIHHSTGI